MDPWTRRRLLQKASLSAPLLIPATNALAQMSMSRMPRRTLDATKLPPFVDPLPLPQRISPQGRRSSPQHQAEDAPYYQVSIKQVEVKLHRDLPPTRIFTYSDSSAPALIETRSNEGVLIDWHNNLPLQHLFPLDSPMQNMPQSAALKNAPATRSIPHMHGARVPHDSDGYPEDWFAPGQTRLCFYPNHQDATALWFHDHAMGVNRLSVYAGLIGNYLIRDDAEAALNLPSGVYEVPLTLYDRSFTPEGQLFYPNPPDEGTWSQKFLGDAMLVNGKVKPFHAVEPRLYRLRITNAANSRFFALGLSNGQSFHVIGSDQGLLEAPVEMERLILAPAERADLLIDFASARGRNVTLTSDSLDLMQFRVANVPASTIPSIPRKLRPTPRIPESQSIRTRLLTLNEYDSEQGEPMVMLLDRKHWADPVTEIVRLNTTEIWSLVNLTDDTHPIHLHMVRFQILDRQAFSPSDYLATDSTNNAAALQFTGSRTPPPMHEQGWKDVVQCPPGTVTRILVPFHGYPGRFLWHCHILEHEANDMMRPYEVLT